MKSALTSVVRRAEKAVDDSFRPPADCYNSCPRGNNAEPDGDSPGVDDRTRSSSKGTQAVERGPDGFGKPGEFEPKIEASADRQEAETYVSGCSQTNRGSSTHPLGEVEGGESKQISRGSQRLGSPFGPCLGLGQRCRRSQCGVLKSEGGGSGALTSYPLRRRSSVRNSSHFLQRHLKLLSFGIARCPHLAQTYLPPPTAFIGRNSSPETQ